MAHVEKYQAAALGNMTDHYERRAEQERGYTRENIDSSKTHLNYNLAPERNSQVEFINTRISELNLKRKPRKDAVRMCDWVVTLPETVPADYQTDFFSATYRFLESRYGAENVISSYVHMDETTPHMHFAFVPITADGRLSAKDVLNRLDLQHFHTELENYLTEKMGIRCGILLDENEQGKKQLSHLNQSEYIAAKKTLEAQQQEISANEVIIEEQNSRLEYLRQRTGDVEIENQRLRDKIAEMESSPKSVAEGLRTLSDARNAKKRGEVLRSDISSLRERISASRERIEGLRIRISELRQQIIKRIRRILTVNSSQLEKRPSSARERIEAAKQKAHEFNQERSRVSRSSGLER